MSMRNDERIKLGIIGVGNMGKNHVRVARELKEEFELVGIFDPSEERVAQLDLTSMACATEEELFERADALIVAAPSSQHKRIGLAAAQAGKHLLMEKPLALSEQDAQTIVNAFEQSGRVLMVDHVERFNPVVQELEKILANERIIGVEIERCSPMDRRISDTDVIYDLMIHDVDILLNALVPKTETRSLSAAGASVYSERYVDYVQALFQFSNDVVASVVSSRATEGKIRKVRIHCETAYIDADLLNRTLTVSRKTSYSLDIGYTPLYSQANVMEQVFVPNAEPLKGAQAHFAACIKDGGVPITDGISAMRCLHALDAIEEQVYGSASNADQRVRSSR